MKVYALLIDFGNGREDVTAVFGNRKLANQRLAANVQRLLDEDDEGTTILGFLVREWAVMG